MRSLKSRWNSPPTCGRAGDGKRSSAASRSNGGAIPESDCRDWKRAIVRGPSNRATATAPSGGGDGSPQHAADPVLPWSAAILPRHAPLLGEHTRKVLAELGFTEGTSMRPRV